MLKNAWVITALVVLVLVLAIAYIPAEQREIRVEGAYWKMSVSVMVSHDTIGHGKKVPMGSSPLEMETLYDRTSCQTREDDCLGEPYQWFTYRTTYWEVTRTETSYGYNFYPVEPNLDLAANEQIQDGSQSLVTKVYIVDSSGYQFVWVPKNLKEFQKFADTAEMTGTYNILGFLLDID